MGAGIVDSEQGAGAEGETADDRTAARQSNATGVDGNRTRVRHRIREYQVPVSALCQAEGYVRGERPAPGRVEPVRVESRVEDGRSTDHDRPAGRPGGE